MDWALPDILRMHGPSLDPVNMGVIPKGDCVNPVLPKTNGQRFEEVPAPQVVPSNVPQNPPPGPSSQNLGTRQPPVIVIQQQPAVQQQGMIQGERRGVSPPVPPTVLQTQQVGGQQVQIQPGTYYQTP